MTILSKLLMATLAIAALILPGRSCYSEQAKPNVLLILTDDQGYGDMACHGNPYIKTPNLDSLHKESVRLTDFHVDPMCAPTRAALMTGRYSARTGVWSTLTGCYIPAAEEFTMGHLFSSNGYATGMFGKWHLGDTYPYGAEDRGFQHVVRHGAGVVGEVPDYWNNDYFDDTYFKNGKPTAFKGHCSEVWVDETIDFIRSTENQPFFCYLAFNAPHGPFNVDTKYSDPYAAMGVPENRARFYGLITHLDEQLGRLIHYLDESDKAEDTIVIFMGDNGTAMGVNKGRDGTCKPVSPLNGYNAGMRDGKTSPYDGGHRNACFIRWPNGGIGSNREIHGLSAHIDLMPTLTELCGLKSPKVHLDGRSLANEILEYKSSFADRILVVHNMQLVKPVKYKDFAVMTNRWRLVNTQRWNQPHAELFDIQSDPGQQTDLSAQFPEVTARLKTDYEKWWQDMTPSFSHVSRQVVGNKAGNPVLLTCHSWKTPSKVRSYNQTHVREGALINDAYWPINVAESGTYRIELRRWPKETDTPIRAGIPAIHEQFTEPRPKGTAFNITKARLQVQDFDQTMSVTKNDKGAAFLVDLKKGTTQLRSWFTYDQEKTINSYYVYVEKI